MLSLVKLGVASRWKRRQQGLAPVLFETHEQGHAERSIATIAALERRIAELLAELSVERDLRTAESDEVARLTAAIRSIWKARIYETVEPADGVSVGLLDAIRYASLVAGLRGSLPNEGETAEPSSQSS